jgi:hypothetical protein
MKKLNVYAPTRQSVMVWWLCVEYKKIITLSLKHEGSTGKSLLKTFVHFVP